MKHKNKKAFTMIELVFVIVIMGIIGKFGVELLAQAYSGFINTKINNELQAGSTQSVEYISKKLQYRIKQSVIAREDDGTFTSLDGYGDATASIIEWIGYDVEGFRGNTAPFWSGVLDLDVSGGNKLLSVGTNTSNELALIKVLSGDNTRNMFSSALYFVGDDVGQDGWGWDGNVSYFDTQKNSSIHPIRRSTTTTNELRPRKGSGNSSTYTNHDNTWTGIKAYEFYQLAWTAYAVGIDDYDPLTKKGTLTLWYDYQPWKGDKYTDANTKKSIIMKDVSTFQFISQHGLMKIQVCVKSDLIKDEEHSICKEKTVF